MYIKLTNIEKKTATLFLLSLNPTKTHGPEIRTGNGKGEPQGENILGRVRNWNRGMSEDDIVQQLITEDPELGRKKTGVSPIGKPVEIKSRAFVDENEQIAEDFVILEEKLDSHGNLTKSGPYKPTEANVEFPLTVHNKNRLKPEDFHRKFVISRVYQMIHTESLGYDFMMDLCKQCGPDFIKVGGGVRGNEPVTLRREGLPMFGYIRCKNEGGKYLCTLHLVNQELKTPTPAETAEK